VISYAAYLRVYEPLGALPDADRARYGGDTATVADRAAGADAEHTCALQRAAAMPPRMVPPPSEESAFVRVVDGLTYVCPWRTRLRCWEALEAFRSMLPALGAGGAEVADTFIPAGLAEVTEAEADRWRREHPGVRSAIVTSTWEVPLVWFALFDPQERQLALGDRRSGQGGPASGVVRELVYLSAMSRVRRRLARALATVRRAMGAGPLTQSLESLGRWLEEFHPHALVELDYGGLVHLLDDAALAEDDSAGDVAASLAALAAGDSEGAQRHYQQLAGRWQAVASAESAN
jgi:hypothetical protein